MRFIEDGSRPLDLYDWLIYHNVRLEDPFFWFHAEDQGQVRDGDVLFDQSDLSDLAMIPLNTKYNRGRYTVGSYNFYLKGTTLENGSPRQILSAFGYRVCRHMFGEWGGSKPPEMNPYHSEQIGLP